MTAIYTAITEQQIIYSTIPASFEEYGQRVRLADSVIPSVSGVVIAVIVINQGEIIVVHLGGPLVGLDEVSRGSRLSIGRVVVSRCERTFVCM